MLVLTTAKRRHAEYSHCLPFKNCHSSILSAFCRRSCLCHAHSILKIDAHKSLVAASATTHAFPVIDTSSPVLSIRCCTFCSLFHPQHSPQSYGKNPRFPYPGHMTLCMHCVSYALQNGKKVKVENEINTFAVQCTTHISLNALCTLHLRSSESFGVFMCILSALLALCSCHDLCTTASGCKSEFGFWWSLHFA